MGPAASVVKKADKYEEGPPTIIVPTAPQPAYNPQYPPGGFQPQPLYPPLPMGHPTEPHSGLAPHTLGAARGPSPVPPFESTLPMAPNPDVPYGPSPGLKYQSMHPMVAFPDGGSSGLHEYLMEIPAIEVVCTGEQKVTTDALKKYFSNNKKSHGGKIASITEDDDCFVINFEDIEIAQEVLSHTHVLEGTQLHVQHRKRPTIEVLTDRAIDVERLRVYFRNMRSSGGGPIDSITVEPNGKYYITFVNKRAVDRVLQKPTHLIDGQEVVVSQKLGAVDRKSLLIKGIPPDCTFGLLQDYLEGLESAQSKLHISRMYRGEDKSVVVVSLLHEIDTTTRNLIAKEVKRDPLKGQTISVSPVVATRSVQLSGVTRRLTGDLLVNYFENTERSGGGKVLDISRDDDKGTAIIRFRDPTVVPRVVSRPIHEFDSGRISVCPHYDALGTVDDTEVPTSSAMPAGQPSGPLLIKRKKLKIPNVGPSKLRLLEKQLPRLTPAFPNVDIDINHNQCEVTIAGEEDEAKQAHDNLMSKVKVFKEFRWSISDEIKSILARENTRKTFENNLAEANVNNDVHFTVENNEVVIWGVDQSAVNTAESCSRATFKESSRNFPKEILGLTDWDDLVTKCCKDANDNAVVLCNKTTGQVKIAGLVREVDHITSKLDGFLKQHSFETSFVNAESLIVNILAKRQKSQIKKIETENEVTIGETRTGFKIVGPCSRMKKVTGAVKGLVSTVIKTTEHYKKPGLSKLFGGDTFQKVLKGVEESQGCVLQWDCKTRTPSPGEKATFKDLRPSTPSLGSSNIGSISVDIGQGSIELESTDVIVNPVTSNKAFTVVGDALVKAGGQKVKDEFEKNWDRRVNSVLLADAGTLRCKNVAHMELLPGDKLKDAVCQCLVLSNQSGARSIAFPAIGTGRGGLKSVQSAKAIRDGIEQFIRQNPAPTLTYIKLTIFVQQMVADFKAELRSPLASLDSTVAGVSSGAISTPSPGQQEMSFGSVRMQVQQGDISGETTDVVVSPILADMGFTVVTKALVGVGGQSIADELKTAWPSRTDKVVFTSAGTLPSKQIAHMVLPSASELKDSVVSCLKAADKLGMKSLSFPAIGTGGKMSQVECAEGIYGGILEFGSGFNPQNVKLVRVTIYDSKMLGTFHSTMQQYSNSSHVAGQPQNQIGSVAVQIQQGDLTKETTDAIVNPVNTDGGFFAVGKALEKAGGATVRTNCESSWNQRTNDVLVTDGGNLPCKKVIHAVCPNARAMKGRVLECLQQAEGMGLTSVSFPAIGTGGFGVSVKDAARETVQGIEEFALKCNPGSVRLVRVTVFQASMVADFQRALQATVPKAPVAIAAPVAVAAAVPRVVKTTPKIDVEQVVEVTFYACDKQDMDNAKREISKTIDGYMKRECVDDDRLKATIHHLGQHEKDSIIDMGADHHVLVTFTGQIVEMEGLKDDVAVVLRKIEGFLREKKNAYDVEQLKKNIINVPDHWTTPPAGVKGAYMHNLQQTSREYKEVEKNFFSSVGYQPQIVSISRVQNEAKYKAYLSELKEKRKMCSTSKIEEWLYHGTAEEVVENINQGGFNRSYCGKNATVYGNGVYFAKNASYSAHDTYSPADSQGNKHIYQARVIVGEYTAGKSGMIEPPPKNPSNAAIRYDSVVDNVQNPSIFVVFHDNEAYPEYLIVFK